MARLSGSFFKTKSLLRVGKPKEHHVFLRGPPHIVDQYKFSGPVFQLGRSKEEKSGDSVHVVQLSVDAVIPAVHKLDTPAFVAGLLNLLR